MADRRILEGVRVLDVTQLVAGPYATRMLADLGADVVRVDRVPHAGSGDGPRRSLGSPALNLGKRSIAVDLKEPDGMAAVLALARRADVLVENFLPGVMERLGLGYEAVSRDNPRLIYASISGFGHGNGRSQRRAFGATAHAEAGWLWVQQRAQGGEVPFAPGVTVADVVTGMNCFSAVLAALYDRERTGHGQRLDLTLMESQLAMLTEVATGPLAGETEDQWRPFRHGLQSTADGGYLTINIGGAHNWARLAAAFDRGGTPMPGDERAASQLLASWVAAHPTADAVRRLEASGAPFGLVRSIHAAVNDPYFAERGTVTVVDDPLLGPTRVVGSPLHFGAAAAGPTGGAPLAGAQSREVLGEAGYDPPGIDRLLASGAVAFQAAPGSEAEAGSS